ncbi:MAG TPA: PIG-L family deacetylase [Longimicrobiales bacterium]|nr:PIG-L family deacetylase [Longimicrobiales bacterium]
MTRPLRLLAVTAHPDDETLGLGGVLARYSSEGVETHVLAATRGERGRYGDGSMHPGEEELGRIREAELRAAAEVLGVGEVCFLDYLDGELDRADPVEAAARIARHVRRIRPHVVMTFAQDGAYGHPDHIAICQLTTAALVVATDPADHDSWSVPKLYYFAWGEGHWDAYQQAFKRFVSTVDGVQRQAVPWPDWMLTACVDCREHWRTVWRAVQCHESQIRIYSALGELSEDRQIALWGWQSFYRVYSLVNGGRAREADLFEGLR